MKLAAAVPLVAASLVAAACGGERALPDVVPVTVYPAALPPWPPAPWTGSIGRGPAPVALVPAPIAARAAMLPLVVERLWATPGDGPARAVVSGAQGERRQVDQIDVDTGAVRWRSDACAGPVLAVTADAVVCAGAQGVIGLGADDGAVRWQQAGRFVAASGDLVIVDDDGAVVIDAAAGTEAARFAPPEGIATSALVAACRRDGAVDVWAWAQGSLVRLDVRGAAAVRAWSAAALGGALPQRVEPCDDTVIVRAEAADGETLLALSRRDGKRLGGPITARGAWTARTGEGLALELAVDDGLSRIGRDLMVPRRLADLQLGRLVASRGGRHLVEDRAGGVVLLDERSALALAGPRGAPQTVLGDRALVALTAGGALERWLVPARTTAPAMTAPAPTARPDERELARFVDLPALRPLDRAAAVAQPAALGATALAIDPDDPALVYVATVEPGDAAGLALFDVRARAWRWYAAGACPAATVAVAVAADVVVCAGKGGAHAVSRSGAPRWRWADAVQALAAGTGAGIGVVAMAAGDRIIVVDAGTGRPIDRFFDDRGGAPRVAMLAGPEPVLVAAERGGVVARAPRLGMLPRWALRVNGIVARIDAVGDRVAIALTSGEAYLVDARGREAVAVAGYAEAWQAAGDLVLRADAAGREWRLAAYGLDGVARFHTGLGGEPPWRLAPARGPDPRSPLVVVHGGGAAVIDPLSGLVTTVVSWTASSDDDAPRLAFATTVDGAPLAGVLFAQPLAIALF